MVQRDPTVASVIACHARGQVFQVQRKRPWWHVRKVVEVNPMVKSKAGAEEGKEQAEWFRHV
jgi:hypothetical protein